MSRRYQENELSTTRDSQSNSLYHAALQQYGKAVAFFRSQLGASLEGNPPSTENALACCVLLIMFEFLQGNAAGLLLNLRSATRLAASVGSSPRAQPFINLLVLIDMVAAVWLNLDRFHFDASPHLPKLNTSRVPLTTHSDLKTLGYDLIHIKNDVTIWRHAVASAHREITAYSFSTVNWQTIQSRLEFWHRQFISVCPNEEDIATHRRSILRANYLLIMLIVDAVHDPQLPAQSTQAGSVSGLGPLKLKYLHEIIELAEGVLKTGYSFRRYDASAGEEPLMGTGLLPLFSFRHSFIQPLFYVAQNGPDMRLRQKAIQLLIEKPWREGAWDSFIMGSIAKRSLDASA